MRVKLIKGNDLNKLEITINNFIDDKKVENIQITSYNQSFICLITYFDKL